LCNTRSNAFEAYKNQHALMNHGLRSMKQFFKIFDVKIVEFSEKNALNCESKTDFNIRAITCYKRSRTRA